jgi:membrane associated rhomboid family serine protease
MLILPIHHRLDARQLPWATLALVLLNLFVFLVLQSGDDARETHARERYAQSGLAAIEVPAWLEAERDQALPPRMRAVLEVWQQAPEPERSMLLSQFIDLDAGFLAGLPGSGRLPDPAEWQALRDAHEQALARSWTQRFQIQSQDFDPARLIGSAFLHGGFGHLLGNMLFLLVLGALVEGAIGSARLLALYVLGAIGSSLASLAWHWGQPHAGLGASGAVAALMGAYCLIWGTNRVRFFYWFFVVFDYVRAPALLLFPFWLGWELFQLWFITDSNVAFDAHAGGLLTGAAFGLLARHLGWVREDFIALEAEADDARHAQALLAEAETELGHLRLEQAQAALDALEEADPELGASPRARLARFRCARYAGHLQQAGAVLSGLLKQPGGLAPAELAALLKDACSGELPLQPQALQAGFTGMLDASRFGTARELLQSMPADLHPLLQPRLWLQLALAQERGGSSPAPTLQEVLTRYPASIEAGKARVLLGG